MTHDSDDQMDQRLRDLARGYNAPGELPRERMWNRVQAARDPLRAPPPVAAAPRTPAGRARRWMPLGGAMLAAAAVLIIGIGIGRDYQRRISTSSAAAIARATPAPSSAAPEPARTPDTLQAARSEAPRALAVAGTRAPKPATSRSPDAPADSTGAPGTAAAERSPQPSAAYRLAMAQHLVGTEAMLTSFRAEARSGQVDAQLTGWARDLLGTTRLLRASAAAQDPAMRRLLGDLELVLVQIAQYSNTEPHHAQELDLIEQSIERRSVISQLRTTIPAGPRSAGT